jgi:hypothetical protein
MRKEVTSLHTIHLSSQRINMDRIKLTKGCHKGEERCLNEISVG